MQKNINSSSIDAELPQDKKNRLLPIQYDKQINAKPIMDRDYSVKIAGCEGLQLRIRPNGKREFRHRYSHPFLKKRPEMTLGIYPTISLKRAKELYQNNLTLLANNIDPLQDREQQQKQLEQSLNSTFEKVASQWLAHRLAVGNAPAQSTLNSYNRMLKYINQQFANAPIDQLTMTTLVSFCQDMQARRGVEVGHDVKTVLNYVFDYAVSRGLVEFNPVKLFPSRSLAPSTNKPEPAITTPVAFAKLLQDIEQMQPKQPDVIPVLKLLALTYARIGDICAMKWADVDLDSQQWRFEPQKGKGRRDMVDELVIPLAPQAVAILTTQFKLTGKQPFVFATAGNRFGYLNPSAVNYALNKYGNDGKGYEGIHCPHGFRASAKTMQMERLGYDELITELQLGHKMLNKYGRAYSRFEFIEQRITMMNEWANYIDDLCLGKISNLLFFKQKTG